MKKSTPAARSHLFWGLTLAALGAARIPYLTSPLYVLDNDEAVSPLPTRVTWDAVSHPWCIGQARAIR
jgi:hypothetical protein